MEITRMAMLTTIKTVLMKIKKQLFRVETGRGGRSWLIGMSQQLQSEPESALRQRGATGAEKGGKRRGN